MIHEQAKRFVRQVPDIRPGYTVRVHEVVQEGGKERIQIFEGLVITMHKGHCLTDRSMTIRRIVSGVGIEKIVPLHSPLITKIDVKKVAQVRRAKLTFLRGRQGKSARLNERFTTSDEFNVAVSAPAKEVDKANEATSPEENPLGLN
ncbi:50S ribosomal protein L19 [Candidatus Peregrinibacteria bacterium]|nr:50S ribosomal protein L19 [Candidatus Peregrinibacteria bacterium]